MLRLIFWLFLASSACAQLTVRERLQSNLQDQRFSQPQQVSQPAVTPSRLAQQPFLGQDSLIKPLPVVQQSFAQQPARQTQQTARQQQLGRLRLEEIRREQELRRQQEIQRQQAARRQLEARRRQQELRQQEENRRREAARLQLERERQRQEATVRDQERQREQEELRQRQQNLRQQEAERRRLQANIPTLDDVRDGPFQDGTYYFGFATGNGIVREEGTRLTGPYTHEVTGSYSYTAPNGEVITMEYIADENGYRAYRARPGRLNPVIPPNRIFEPPPYRPPTISPLENRPFTSPANRPRPTSVIRPVAPQNTNLPITGSTNQRPQNFNIQVTPRPQVFSAPNTPRPQIFSAPNTPRPQIFSAPNTPRPQIFSAPNTPRPQIFNSQILPRPQSFNTVQPQTFSTNANTNFNNQDLQLPQTFSTNQPASSFSDQNVQQPQTFGTSTFSRRVGLDEILTLPEEEYDYGGTLTQAVLGARPPSTFDSVLDV
ncbi:stress response protein NST1-like [Penaeus chinensis]|uniref:stress response protein NST1-like n=1 Tax=Penaeus chinensis TaxID=139456 RepID=UPI001FB69CA8|nr:stress response protein NST1-like [Penaeus chinensis]